MSSANASKSSTTNRLELTRAQAWVVHHVVLEHLLDEDADEQPWWALETARKLEAGRRRFTVFEAWRLRCALLDYAGSEDAPDADVADSMAVVDELDRQFGTPPAAIC